jgi:MFS family permease
VNSRQQRRTFLSVVAAALVGSYLLNAMNPVQEAMRVGLALNDNQMAVLQGPATALPIMIGAIPIGLLVDRTSRVRILVICLTAAIAGSLLTVFATDFWQLFSARFLVGLSTGATSIAATSLITDSSSREQRGRATMILAWGQVIGMAAAFGVCGYLLSRFGAEPSGWRWTLAIASSPLIAILLLLLTLSEPARTGRHIKHPTIREGFVELKQYRGIVITLITASVIVRIADSAAVVWTAPIFARDFGLSPASIGTLMGTTIMVSGISGPALAGFLADICQQSGGPKQTVRVFSYFVLLSVPTSLYPLAPSGPTAVILFALFYVVGVMSGTLFTAVASVVIPNELFGLCMSLFALVSAIVGTGLSPLLVSGFASALGGPSHIGAALAIVCVSTSFLGSIVYLIGSRYFPTEMAAT